MPNQENLNPNLNEALELLSLSGREDSIDILQAQFDIPEDHISQFRGRAIFRQTLERLRENSLEAQYLFEQLPKKGDFSNYCREFADAEDALSLIKVLNSILDMDMEADTQIDAVYLLSYEPMQACIQNNLLNMKVQQPFSEFISDAYKIIFSTGCIEESHVIDLFPVVDQWRHLVDPKQVVRQSIGELGNLEADELLTAIIERQSIMTSREFVSDCFYEFYSDTDELALLVKSGLIDAPVSEEERSNAMSERTKNALQKFQRFYLTDLNMEHAVLELEKNLGADGPSHVARSMKTWFKQGRISPLHALLTYGSAKSFDLKLARRGITTLLLETVKGEDKTLLVRALELPELLIDSDVPEFEGIRLAQKALRGDFVANSDQSEPGNK